MRSTQSNRSLELELVTVALMVTTLSMTELMDRLRIPYTEVRVFAEAELEPSDQRYRVRCRERFQTKVLLSKERFRGFVGNFMSKSDVSSKIKLTKTDLSKFEDKVHLSVH